MATIQESGERVAANVERVIVGKHQEVRLALVALLCQGHLLIEDVPGTGKTVLAKAIARTLGCIFQRIQFTPDLLPTDVTGLSIFNQKTQEFEFRPGPIITQIVLADEINRATPKTQSALLECDGGAPDDGRRHHLPDARSRSWSSPRRTRSSTRARSRCRRRSSTASCCACAWATPSRRGDRHPRRAEADAPDRGARRGGHVSMTCVAMQLGVREIYVDPAVSATTSSGWSNATRNHPDVYLGASPRGSLALYRASQACAALAGRDYVIPDDIKSLAVPALAHRTIIKTAATVRDVDAA